MKDRVIIYRNQLFKISESFIVNQASNLDSFEPVYMGRKLFSNSPNGYKTISMDSESLFKNLKYIIFRDSSYFYNNSKDLNPKLIHAHFGVEGVYALNLAKKLNIPLITTFHGFDATTNDSAFLFSKKPAWLNYILFRKELAKRGDLFICVSDFIRDRLLDIGFPKERVVTHYIGIDTDIKQDNNIAKPPYRVILHVARLTQKKGTKYLIDAFSKVVKEIKDVKLVIIGDGPLSSCLKEQVKELSLIDRVEFLGAREHSEVLEWMQRADIFSLPSITAKNGDSEGLGMVFLEAALYSVATVATKSGGIPEVVENNKTGLLVSEKNSEELAKALLKLLKDDKLREELGKEANKMVKEKFDINKQSRKLEELYRGLL